MSQADSLPTTRRSFLAGAATLPTAAIPAIALAAEPFGYPELEAALIAASEEAEVAADAHRGCRLRSSEMAGG